MPKAGFDEFELQGQKFRLRPLPLKVSRELLPVVGEALKPFVGMMVSGQPGFIEKAFDQGIEKLKNTTPLADAFAPYTSVEFSAGKTPDGTSPWLPMSEDLMNQIFGRKHSLYLNWVAKCTMLEFADFLAGTGQLLGLEATGSPSDSPTSSTGSSGDSP